MGPPHLQLLQNPESPPRGCYDPPHTHPFCTETGSPECLPIYFERLTAKGLASRIGSERGLEVQLGAQREQVLTAQPEDARQIIEDPVPKLFVFGVVMLV